MTTTTISQDEVFEVVRRHLTQICEEIAPESVRPEASMKELGASSLDIVEVVSCSMRELRVRIPRSELAKLTSIGALAALLHQEALKKAGAAG